MRIDKLLWAFRYFKTRNNASEACKKNQVKVNGNLVKPSKDVFTSDCIELRKNQMNYTFEIITIPKNRIGAKLLDIHRKDTTPKESFEALELLKYSKDHYRKKGTGRPTKKEKVLRKGGGRANGWWADALVRPRGARD